MLITLNKRPGWQGWAMKWDGTEEGAHAIACQLALILRKSPEQLYHRYVDVNDFTWKCSFHTPSYKTFVRNGMYFAYTKSPDGTEFFEDWNDNILESWYDPKLEDGLTPFTRRILKDWMNYR